MIQRAGSLGVRIKAMEPLVHNKFEVLDNYDWTRNTKENYQADGREQSGPYASIRSRILFDVHGCYIARRQEMQDKFIDEVIGAGEGSDHPWAVFSAGAFFSGKSFVIPWMQKQGYLALPNLVRTDPDYFRMRLPEWKRYLEANPHTAGEMTHVEAGTCSLIAQWESMRQGRHVFIDGSLQHYPRQSEFFGEIRAAHPQYRIAIINVHCDWDILLKRSAIPREGGRVISEEVLKRCFDNVNESVAKLEALANLVVHVENNSETPQLARVVMDGVPKPGTWQDVRSCLGEPAAACLIL
mmetsp:Transcript_3026/g.6033  ORF Transcript_3026/g.6033 Transcript_3026/m.6033 type:complete len:297 (+) Transcript_3026:2-892(+)